MCPASNGVEVEVVLRGVGGNVLEPRSQREGSVLLSIYEVALHVRHQSGTVGIMSAGRLVLAPVRNEARAILAAEVDHWGARAVDAVPVRGQVDVRRDELCPTAKDIRSAMHAAVAAELAIHVGRGFTVRIAGERLNQRVEAELTEHVVALILCHGLGLRWRCYGTLRHALRVPGVHLRAAEARRAACRTGPASAATLDPRSGAGGTGVRDGQCGSNGQQQRPERHACKRPLEQGCLSCGDYTISEP